MIAVAFAAAAGAGGVLRHLINRLGYGWRGTLAINLVGAFLLGLLLAAHPGDGVRTALGTGGLGAFTTFSALSLEATEGSARQRVAIVVASSAGGVTAAALGWWLGS